MNKQNFLQESEQKNLSLLWSKSYNEVTSSKNLEYLRAKEEGNTFKVINEIPFGKEKGFYGYTYSKLPKDEKAKIDLLQKNYLNSIKTNINKYIQESDARWKKLSMVLGSNLAYGPIGHEQQQYLTISNISAIMATQGRDEDLKTLKNLVDKRESINLKDFGFSINDKWIHLDPKKILSGQLEEALFDQNGVCKLSELEIQGLKRVIIGVWKDGDSLLFQNNDRAALYPDGYLSGKVVPGVKSSKDVYDQILKIINNGRISSSFDAGFNYHTMANKEVGIKYEAIKLYIHNLIRTQIVNYAPLYSKYPDVLRQLPAMMYVFMDEAYNTLIKAVSTSQKEDTMSRQLDQSKALAEMFYYMVPMIIEKANKIMVDSKNNEKYLDNKTDYYLFMSYLVQGVFEIIKDGKEKIIGVPQLGAIRLDFKKDQTPLNDYLSGKAVFPSKSNEIRDLANKIINSISGECQVQQIRFNVQLVEKGNQVRAIVKFLPPDNVLLDVQPGNRDNSQIIFYTETIKFSSGMFAGLPGKWKSSKNYNEKDKYNLPFNSIMNVHKNNRFEFDLPQILSQQDLNLSGVFKIKGNEFKFLKPFKFETAEIKIKAPESLPISIPFFIKNNIKTGSGIGGVPPGFESRFSERISSLINQAWDLQKNADQNPINLVEVNKLIYDSIKEAYKLDPAKVGGDATKKWLEDNKDSIREGKFKTQMPNELLSSQFGSELSLVNVPKQLKMDQTRSVNALDIYIKKDLYIKTGWIQYDTKYIFASIKDYDENGNPIFKYTDKSVKSKEFLKGLGYHLKLDEKEKLKIEFFGGGKDWTIKSMSEEDRTILQKFGEHIIHEWEGNKLKVAGRKLIELVNLLDEMTLTKYDDRWLMQGRTNNLSMPLSIPFSWIGIDGLPANLNWRTVFNIDFIDGSPRTSINKELGNILDLNVKTNNYAWSIWEYFNGDVLSPKGFGAELRIQGKKSELGIGLSLMPKPGRDVVDFNNIFKNNIPNGHLSIRF
ncbi:MAG: hypothetical protein QXE90_03420 [Candidatus Micrarchaeia archaeon]